MKYVPKSKLSKPRQATPRELRVSKSGLDFTGEYVHTTSGKYYAYVGGQADFAQELTRVLDQESSHDHDDEDLLPREGFYFNYTAIQGKSLTYTEEVPEPSYILTEQIYTQGYYLRYYAKHLPSGEVREIGNRVYNAMLARTEEFHWPSYQLVSLVWIISGNVADQEINGYIVEGVETLNKKAVREASKVIPELSNIITDYLEYHK